MCFERVGGSPRVVLILHQLCLGCMFVRLFGYYRRFVYFVLFCSILVSFCLSLVFLLRSRLDVLFFGPLFCFGILASVSGWACVVMNLSGGGALRTFPSDRWLSGASDVSVSGLWPRLGMKEPPQSFSSISPYPLSFLFVLYVCYDGGACLSGAVFFGTGDLGFLLWVRRGFLGFDGAS